MQLGFKHADTTSQGIISQAAYSGHNIDVDIVASFPMPHTIFKTLSLKIVEKIGNPRTNQYSAVPFFCSC